MMQGYRYIFNEQKFRLRREEFCELLFCRKELSVAVVSPLAAAVLCYCSLPRARDEIADELRWGHEGCASEGASYLDDFLDSMVERKVLLRDG